MIRVSDADISITGTAFTIVATGIQVFVIMDAFESDDCSCSFTPFRIEDAQSNGSNPVISAPEKGILNEKWCK